MKKYIISIFIIIAIIIFAIFFIFNRSNNYTNTDNISASRTSTESKNDLSENINNTTYNDFSQAKEISSYATEIKDNSPGRLTNINITCSVLNNTIVLPGQTFSFNEVVGQPTAERGYQEASVIINHKTEKGIGGGNCQVSSTLYNAVLAVPTLSVVERHEHGKDVAYVPEGKDAAVSYGSLDLKFINNSEKSIMINSATDNSSITIKLLEL